MPKKIDDEQIEMFPVPTVINNIGLTKVTIKNNSIDATLVAATNVNDAVKLSQEAWQHAIAEWLLTLCQGNHNTASEILSAVCLEQDHANENRVAH